MAIKGTQKEQLESKEKKIGLGEYKVVAVNPSREEWKDLFGTELGEESKADHYLGESRDGNTTLRIDFWGENTKTKELQKTTFFLEDKYKENKIGEKDVDKVKKYQFINNAGSTTWAEDENDLKQWFTQYGYRKAKVGEEELYTFCRYWLGKMDTFKVGVELAFTWKTLMKGNVKEIAEQIKGEFSVPFLWLLTVKTVAKEGEETKQYQNVYNRNFLPSYVLSYFSQKDYMSEPVLAAIKAKEQAMKDKKAGGGTVDKADKLKNFEYFVLQVMDSQFGCKDFFKLKPLKAYNPEENLVTSDNAMEPVGTDDLPF